MAGIRSDHLRVLREKDGQSQKELAKAVGISLQYLCDIEAGRRTLKRNPGLVLRLAEALGVPVSMLARSDEPDVTFEGVA